MAQIKNRKYRKSDKPIGQHQVDIAGYINALSGRGGLDFLDYSGDKSVTFIGHDDLGIVIEALLKVLAQCLGGLQDFKAEFFGILQNPFFYDLVIFQQLDRGPAGIIGNCSIGFFF